MLTVEFANGSVMLNGALLILPAERGALVQIIGEPSRVSHTQYNSILTWDDDGIFAYQIPENEQLRSFAVAIDREGYNFSPKNIFPGLLSVEGAVVTRNSTVSSINDAISLKAFVAQEDEDEDDDIVFWELASKDCILYLTTKGAAKQLTTLNLDMKEEEDEFEDIQ